MSFFGKLKKIGKSVAKGVGNLVDASAHPMSTLKRTGKDLGLLAPDMPAMPDQPLMPDYEGIAKARRRGRTRRLGRTETLDMTSDTLG